MIRSRFTLKQLEALVFVVDQGTFRRAADALGTTQPNISARIAALEATLGQLLLFRDAGSVRVTEQGEKVLAEARKILRASEALLEVADRQDLIAERLRLGVTELIACTTLHDILRRITQAYPQLRISLEVSLATEIVERLRANELDLALLSGPVPGAELARLPLFQSPYVWVATPALAATLPQDAALAAVMSRPVITHARNTQAVAALEAACKARGISFERTVQSSSLAACLPMARDGMGVALLPQDLVQDALESGALQAIPCNWVPEPLAFFASYKPARAPGFVLRAAEIAAEVLARPEDQENLSPVENQTI